MMIARRWLAVALVLALALCWLGCESQQSKGGTLAPHYVKGEGYKK